MSLVHNKRPEENQSGKGKKVKSRILILKKKNRALFYPCYIFVNQYNTKHFNKIKLGKRLFSQTFSAEKIFLN